MVDVITMVRAHKINYVDRQEANDFQGQAFLFLQQPDLSKVSRVLRELL
jgi:hypothetical protein